MDNNYAKSYIYGIKCYTTGELYIGSSYEDINRRLSKHKVDFRGYMGITPAYRNYRSSFEVLMNENYKIFKIEDWPCDSKQELETRESLWIQKYRKIVCNKRIPRKVANLAGKAFFTHLPLACP
tara:strand:+ start:3023 stop:3394 length:372 start_codon:yes stop_codon:yes gene_type:complete